MSPSEAQAKWDGEKAALLAELRALPLDQKKTLVAQALRYRSGPDSCNSAYMGSMATAIVIGALGGEYGKDGATKLLKGADQAKVDHALDGCAAIISYMRKHKRAQ